MAYTFKNWPELVRSILIAVFTVLVTALSGLDPSAITDWRAWAAGVGVGMLHAGFVAALGWLTKQETGVTP